LEAAGVRDARRLAGSTIGGLAAAIPWWRRGFACATSANRECGTMHLRAALFPI